MDNPVDNLEKSLKLVEELVKDETSLYNGEEVSKDSFETILKSFEDRERRRRNNIRKKLTYKGKSDLFSEQNDNIEVEVDSDGSIKPFEIPFKRILEQYPNPKENSLERYYVKDFDGNIVKDSMGNILLTLGGVLSPTNEIIPLASHSPLPPSPILEDSDIINIVEQNNSSLQAPVMKHDEILASLADKDPNGLTRAEKTLLKMAKESETYRLKRPKKIGKIRETNALMFSHNWKPKYNEYLDYLAISEGSCTNHIAYARSVDPSVVRKDLKHLEKAKLVQRLDYFGRGDFWALTEKGYILANRSERRFKSPQIPLAHAVAKHVLTYLTSHLYSGNLDVLKLSSLGLDYPIKNRINPRPTASKAQALTWGETIVNESVIKSSFKKTIENKTRSEFKPLLIKRRDDLFKKWFADSNNGLSEKAVFTRNSNVPNFTRTSNYNPNNPIPPHPSTRKKLSEILAQPPTAKDLSTTYLPSAQRQQPATHSLTTNITNTNSESTRRKPLPKEIYYGKDGTKFYVDENLIHYRFKDSTLIPLDEKYQDKAREGAFAYKDSEGNFYNEKTNPQTATKNTETNSATKAESESSETHASSGTELFNSLFARHETNLPQEQLLPKEENSNKPQAYRDLDKALSKKIDFNKNVISEIFSSDTELKEYYTEFSPRPETIEGNEFLYALVTDESSKRTYHIPDLVLQRPHNKETGAPKNIAIEVERNMKPYEEYLDIMRIYLKDTLIYDKVIWVVTRTDVARTLQDVAIRLGAYGTKMSIVGVYDRNGNICTETKGNRLGIWNI